MLGIQVSGFLTKHSDRSSQQLFIIYFSFHRQIYFDCLCLYWNKTKPPRISSFALQSFCYNSCFLWLSFKLQWKHACSFPIIEGSFLLSLGNIWLSTCSLCLLLRLIMNPFSGQSELTGLLWFSRAVCYIFRFPDCFECVCFSGYAGLF